MFLYKLLKKSTVICLFIIREFSILEKEINQVIIIKENVYPILNAMKTLICLNNHETDESGFTDNGTVCLIKIQIDTNQVKCIRIISVKGIIGVIFY
jgi:hypothetical protein